MGIVGTSIHTGKKWTGGSIIVAGGDHGANLVYGVELAVCCRVRGCGKKE